MNYQQNNVAIAQHAEDLKSAALYYDSVIPFPVARQQTYLDVLANFDITEKIMSPALNFHTFLHLMLFQALDAFRNDDISLANACKDAIENSALKSRRSVIERLWALCESNDSDSLVNSWWYNMQTFLPSEPDIFSEREKAILNDTTDVSNPSFILSNLNVINSEMLTWDHIFSIREDTESIDKLRRLRTFVFENFDNKPIEYVEDKLGLAIADYNAAAKKHAIDLNNGAFTVVASEKVMSGCAAGLLTAIAGAPFSVSAAIGASAVLAGALIEIRTLRKKHFVDQSINPVRFLVDIQTKDIK